MDQHTPYLFFDTETGGVDPSQHSLLSMGLVIGGSDQIMAQTEILIRHDTYSVTAGGMKVNKIDLVTHHEQAMEPQQAWEAMEAFLVPYFPPKERIVLVGHNISFDRAFLGGFLKSLGQALETRFSHRSIDTHAVAAALQDAGRIPRAVALTSSSLFDHFQITIPPEKRHTSMGDALGTFELYWRMVALAR